LAFLLAKSLDAHQTPALFTTSPFDPPGRQIYTTITLSRVGPGQVTFAVAGIYDWELYPNGVALTPQVSNPHGGYLTRNFAFLGACKTVTYVVATDGIATAQVSVADW
jgi:hypothetical protein